MLGRTGIINILSDFGIGAFTLCLHLKVPVSEITSVMYLSDIKSYVSIQAAYVSVWVACISVRAACISV